MNQLFKGQKVIRNLTYNATEKYGDDEQSKKVLFDLLCTCDNDEQIIVEMQRAEQQYIKNRKGRPQYDPGGPAHKVDL
ncbi:MAG: hypothetical protein ABS46_19750 [Cytophagaceae bacterium SCN 52-12]|nr:MAG: hypothetical protein ABS46_19750 [Cytophagaceae bacterium SCN 52-12]